MRALPPLLAGFLLVSACGKLPPEAYGSSSPPTNYGNVPAPYYGSVDDTMPTLDIVQCADRFHPDRPGGPDYVGLPVPGCPAEP